MLPIVSSNILIIDSESLTALLGILINFILYLAQISSFFLSLIAVVLLPTYPPPSISNAPTVLYCQLNKTLIT